MEIYICQKTKRVVFANHLVLIVTSGMMTWTIFFVFWEALAVQNRNYYKMCMLPMPFFRSVNTYFWWCLRNWEVKHKDLYRDIIWQSTLGLYVYVFHTYTKKIHFQGYECTSSFWILSVYNGQIAISCKISFLHRSRKLRSLKVTIIFFFLY